MLKIKMFYHFHTLVVQNSQKSDDKMTKNGTLLMNMLERMLDDNSIQAGIYAQAYRFFEASNINSIEGHNLIFAAQSVEYYPGRTAIVVIGPPSHMKVVSFQDVQLILLGPLRSSLRLLQPFMLLLCRDGTMLLPRVR